jgi:4'-phosphopantetheinyl transferase
MSTTIDIYVADTAVLDESGVAQACDAFFSRADIEEFEKFAVAEPKRERRLARALVRIALARLTGREPGEWHFVRSDAGKLLVVADQVLPLDFSISHARGLVVCAVTSPGRIGVDIEHFGRHVQSSTIAKRFFTPAEAKAVESAPDDARSAKFLQLWALKEAYLKAHGTGLSESLQSVEFELAARPRITSTRFDGDSPERWQVELFAPDPDFVGAVIAEHGGQPRELRIIRMSGGDFCGG